MALRPDELANEAEIERDRKFRGNIKKGVVTAASIAGTSAGVAMASKVMPFLSEYIPAELALKGLDRVAPGIGKFLRRGMEKGLSLKSGLDFVKGELTPKEKETGQPKEERSIIEQYSPELHNFLDQEVKNGANPMVAGLQAKESGQFKNVIRKMEQDHKIPWSAIISSVFGESPGSEPGENHDGGQFQQPQQMQQQGQQQNNQNSPLDAITQAIQAYTQIRGNRGS